MKWRDEAGRQRARTFTAKRDATAWDAKVHLLKRTGDVAELDAGKQTLAKFIDLWWNRYALIHLAPKTLATYASIKNVHIVPHLGHLPLRRITPSRVQEFHQALAADGVGTETIRKTLAMLQGVFERGVEWGYVPRNPVRSIRKPASVRTTRVRPLAPTDVERLRRELHRREWWRDATLVSVLAYAGLRPGEAIALRWKDVGRQTLAIDKSISLGVETSTKTRARRTVRLLPPLVDDLSAWRKLSGNPAQDALVFPTKDGNIWSDADYRNWRRRRFTVATEAVGLPDVRVYDLRHSYASLLMHEQLNVTEIAAQMGHSLQTLFDTYAHVIEELRGKRAAKAATLIAKARRGVPEKFPSARRGTVTVALRKKKIPA